MMRPKRIQQPGPEQQPRIVAVEARGRSISFDLEPGQQLLDAVHQGFAAHGFQSGVAELGAVKLGPLAYVMPALSKDGANAAFYSDIYRPGGITVLEQGALTFGRRDGAPFFHCHALWREASGKRTGGHILPEEAIIAERISVTALGIDGATFEAVLDPETNFKIFGPVKTPEANAQTTGRVLVLRLRPNQDFFGALEAAAAAHGITRARIRGGVGSTIGAQFADGTIVPNFATEVFITSGEIKPDSNDSPRAAIDAALVDYTGALASGTLVRDINPVLMTFELALEELKD